MNIISNRFYRLLRENKLTSYVKFIPVIAE